MNIHFSDKNLFEELKKASLIEAQFGSVLYRTNDEFSDVDIHYVYATSVNELNSFLKSHHHLQFYEDGKDHIFVSLHTFLHNLLRGDSTVLFEILHSNALENTPLAFLHNMKGAFCNYTMIRSYLGFAKRDIQFYHKAKSHREQIKSLGHIYRGYYFAKSILDSNFLLINNDFLTIFTQLKAIGETDFVEKKRWLANGQKIVTELREELNYKFNNNTLYLPKYMTVENQIWLDEKIKNLMLSCSWEIKQTALANFDLKIFYDAFENEINYQ